MSRSAQASPVGDRGSAASSSATNLSFAERAAKNPKSPTPKPVLVNGNKIMRDIDRPLPGDAAQQPPRPRSKPELAKQRSNINFFEDAFAMSETSHVKERIYGDSMVLAEIKTNVIINDEFSFITELSYLLSSRYQRPITSIVVSLHHSTCMLYAGSLDPAYIMSITALPSQLQPTTNKRNAALIQRHMEDVLGVAPSRGLLRFVPTNDEHLASNGNTVAGEIEEAEKSQGISLPTTGGDEGNSSLFRRKSRKLGVKVGYGPSHISNSLTNFSQKSFPSFRQPNPSNRPQPQPELTPPGSANEVLATVPEYPTTSPAEPEAKRKQAKRKKSFVAAMFGRSNTTKSAYRNSLPTVSGD
ncbi:Tautomerase/MIF superfamily [Rhypophila decipiens]